MPTLPRTHVRETTGAPVLYVFREIVVLMATVGHIYIVWGIGTNLIKVGKTTNLMQRFRTLSQQAPVPLELLQAEYVADIDASEAALKLRYREYHSHGEWYALPNDLLAQWPCTANGKPIVLYGQAKHVVPRRLAEIWLKGRLEGEPQPSSIIEAEALANGITRRTLRRARERLAVRAVQKGGNWYLVLEQSKRGV